MSFDLLPKFLSVITGPGERQLNEPGFNALDNCGPAAGSVLMQILGYQDIEPQVWTDYEYWPTYRGGETYEALNDFIASHYPNPPIMSIESPADQLAAINQWGSAGLLVIGLFWSSSGAVYQPYQTGIGHFGLVLGYDGATVTVWNPELGVQVLPVALFKGASQNLYDVCHRPISSTGATAGSEVIAGGMDLTQQEHDWLASVVTALGLGTVDSKPNYLGWSQSITKGIADIEAAIKALPSQEANLQPVLDAVTALKSSIPTHLTGALTVNP